MPRAAIWRAETRLHLGEQSPAEADLWPKMIPPQYALSAMTGRSASAHDLLLISRSFGTRNRTFRFSKSLGQVQLAQERLIARVPFEIL